MSEEEDKSTLNDVDNAVPNPPSNEGDSDSQSDSLLVNGNENTPPCQLDIGLGTHTDSRRHDNTLNVNGKYINSYINVYHPQLCSIVNSHFVELLNFIHIQIAKECIIQ